MIELSNRELITATLPKQIPEAARKMLFATVFNPKISEDTLYLNLRPLLREEPELNVKLLAKRITMFREGQDFIIPKTPEDLEKPVEIVVNDYGVKALIELFGDGIKETYDYIEGLKLIRKAD
jgi:hypothetical protein